MSILLINKRKQTLKIIGIIFLYIGAALAFYIPYRARNKTEQKPSSSPSPTISPSPSPNQDYPEISIPPQPTYKPVIKSPSPKS